MIAIAKQDRRQNNNHLAFEDLLPADFRDKYLKRTGTTDHLISAAVHYDGVLALKKALQMDKSVPLIERLQLVKPFVGAHSKAAIVHAKLDHYFDLPFTTYQIINGKIVNLYPRQIKMP